MDAFVVEQSFDADGNGHVVGRTATSDVDRCDDSSRRQLPDVQLMHTLDPFHLPTDIVSTVSQSPHNYEG